MRTLVFVPVVAPSERREASSPPARRGVWCFGLFALGFVCGSRAEPVDPLAFVAAALALLVIALLTRGWACRVSLALAAVTFSAGWIGVRTRTADPMTLWASAIAPHEGAVMTVEGLVLTAPRVQAAGRGELTLDSPLARRAGAAFELDARRAVTEDGAPPIRGVVLVRLDGARRPSVSSGDFIRVTGVFTPVSGPLNPGEPDQRVWAVERGRVGRLSVSSATLIEPAESDASLPDRVRAAWLRVVGGLRGRVDAGLDAVAGPVDAAGPAERSRALLAVLLLGQREQGIEQIEGPFARMGLVHVLAISGFHLAVLAWAVLWLVRLTGERGRLEGLAVGGVVLVYLVLVPAEAPVLRCGVTVLAFLVIHASGRRYDRLNTLAWVAIGLLMWRPTDLWSPGFQLSFGVVAALLTCADATTRRFFGTPLRAGSGVRAGAGIHPAARTTLGRFGDAVLHHGKGLVASSVLCWAVASALVAYHAGWFSPLAALTGLVVVPLAAALLCVGYASLLVGAISPTLGEWIGGPARWMADALAGAIAWLDQSTWSSVPLPLLGAWWAAFATFAVAMVFSWRARPRWKPWVSWAALAIAGVWLAGEVMFRGRLAPGVVLRIDTLAVGDGTCHVVRSRRPDAPWWRGWERDEVLVWDAGSLRADIGLRALPRAVRHAGGGGVWDAPSVVVTHPNTDHYVAIPELIRPLGVRRVLTTEAFVETARARPGAPPGQLLSVLERRAVEVRVLARGDAFTLGAARASVLWPPDGARFIADNDASLVVRFEVLTAAGPRALLLTGDIGREAIARLMADDDAGSLRADVLEVPHHGSFSDLAAEFIVRTDAGVVLQSTGPRRALDARLAPLKASRSWFATALDGAAWAEIHADGTVRSGSLRRGEDAPASMASPGVR